MWTNASGLGVQPYWGLRQGRFLGVVGIFGLSLAVVVGAHFLVIKSSNEIVLENLWLWLIFLGLLFLLGFGLVTRRIAPVCHEKLDKN